MNLDYGSCNVKAASSVSGVTGLKLGGSTQPSKLLTLTDFCPICEKLKLR